jgi:hypothetical protein
VSEERTRTAEAFPYGVEPEIPVDEGTEDNRGADTVNRLLLHGARYHDRDGVFTCWEQGRKGWAWTPTPDWRADRHAIRVALVLHQRMGIEANEALAMWLPLDLEWPAIERAIWSIGALSVPVYPEWNLDRVSEVLHEAAPAALFAPDVDTFRELKAVGGVPDSVRATILMRGSADELGEEALAYDRFMDYGGVLDTPERASMWRTAVREARPDKRISWEYDWNDDGLRRSVISQGGMAQTVERILRCVPPRKGGVQLLVGERPDRIARALVFAGWADGLTTTAFVLTPAAGERAAELAPDLLAGRAEPLEGLLEALARGAAGPDGNGSSAAEDRTWVCVTDRAGSTELGGDGIASARRLSFLDVTDFDSLLTEG